MLPRTALALAALTALAASASADLGTPPRGKFAKDKKDKKEWGDSLNSWQAKENQEFMREYDVSTQAALLLLAISRAFLALTDCCEYPFGLLLLGLPGLF